MPPLTATEQGFINEDLRHVELRFAESTSDGDKLHYAECAASIWRAIAAIYLEKMTAKNSLDNREAAE